MTSGTTGKPTIFLKSKDDLKIYKKENVPISFVGIGIKRGDKAVNYFPYVNIPIKIGKKDYIAQNLSGPGAGDGLKELGVEQIEIDSIKPGVANVALALSSQIDRFGRKYELERGDPKELGFERILVSGEPTSKSKRKYLEDIFDSEVYDLYASTEFSTMSFECKERNGMHINESTSHIEITDPETAEFLSPGEEGHVTLTNLLPVGKKGGTVLLNYDIEDLSKKLEYEKCSCGRVFEKISNPRRASNEFIAGAVKFKPEVFEDLLCESKFIGKNITPEYQIILDFDEKERQDILILNVETKENIKNMDEKIRNYIIKNHPYLKDTVSRDTVKFEVKCTENIEKPKGKPKRLIDKRQKY